jgi:hypothetical protein
MPDPIETKKAWWRIGSRCKFGLDQARSHESPLEEWAADVRNDIPVLNKTTVLDAKVSIQFAGRAPEENHVRPDLQIAIVGCASFLRTDR